MSSLQLWGVEIRSYYGWRLFCGSMHFYIFFPSQLPPPISLHFLLFFFLCTSNFNKFYSWWGLFIARWCMRWVLSIIGMWITNYFNLITGQHIMPQFWLQNPSCSKYYLLLLLLWASNCLESALDLYWINTLGTFAYARQKKAFFQTFSSFVGKFYRHPIENAFLHNCRDFCSFLWFLLAKKHSLIFYRSIESVFAILIFPIKSGCTTMPLICI